MLNQMLAQNFSQLFELYYSVAKIQIKFVAQAQEKSAKKLIKRKRQKTAKKNKNQ